MYMAESGLFWLHEIVACADYHDQVDQVGNMHATAIIDADVVVVLHW
jgi:hypothetical protein